MIFRMKRPAKGSTVKQFAYARRKFGGEGKTKKEIALMSGFSKSVAENAKNKIESTEGYQNAMIELAAESNNLVLAILAEYKARGISDFSNKDLNGALNAISHAWEKFDKARRPNQMQTPQGNPLRAMVMQRVENQTINVAQPSSEIPATTSPSPAPVEIPPTPAPAEDPAKDIDLDF